MHTKLDARIKRLQKIKARYQSQLQTWRQWRLILGLADIVLLVTTTQVKSMLLVMTFTALIIATALFIYLVRHTRKLVRFLGQLSLLNEYYLRQRLRLEGKASFRQPGRRQDLDILDDLLAKDLDLKDVLGLFDETCSVVAQTKIQQLFYYTKQRSEEVFLRQKLIQNLGGYPGVIKRFLRGFWQNQPTAEQSESLSELLNAPSVGPKFTLYGKIHVVLAPLIWVLAIASLISNTAWNFYHPLIAYFFFQVWTRSQVALSFTRAQELASQVQQMIRPFEVIKRHQDLNIIKKCFPQSLQVNPYRLLKQAQTTVHFLSLQGNPILHAVVHFIFPWDYLFALRLERWRDQAKKNLPLCLEELYDFEVICSLGHLYLYHSRTFPQVTTELKLSYVGLYHPLVERDKVVTNDFAMAHPEKVVIITGSNMSGKSTFLRTVGINQILALMGAPVFAQSMQTFMGPVKSCLRVTDSIDEGISSFYFEVKQIKEILATAESGIQFLFLIDEIFRGTNNRERLLGSQSVLKALVTHKQILGLVSTHDLELAQLAESNPQIRNCHFRDDIENGRMVFPYKIYPGPCPTTNAIRIMQNEGLPVPLPG